MNYGSSLSLFLLLFPTNIPVEALQQPGLEAYLSSPFRRRFGFTVTPLFFCLVNVKGKEQRVNGVELQVTLFPCWWQPFWNSIAVRVGSVPKKKIKRLAQKHLKPQQATRNETEQSHRGANSNVDDGEFLPLFYIWTPLSLLSHSLEKCSSAATINWSVD